MDREQLLKQETDKLIEIGRAKGSISEDDIMARLEHLGASAEDLEGVFKALEAEKITVVSAKEDDIDTIIDGNFDDSVKMYLKDIGKVPLLSAEMEVELCPVSKASQSLSFLLGNPLRPSVFLSVGN